MTAEHVQFLHDDAGLSWAEIGLLVGVGRRAVHAWSFGSRINTSNAARLADVVDAVGPTDGRTPEQMHASIFDSSNGPSAFHRLHMQVAGRQQIINSSYISPAELFGLNSD